MIEDIDLDKAFARLMSKTERWPTYQSYKPSGVSWLGELPAHWQVNRLKYIAHLSQQHFDQKPDELPYLGLEQIESRTGRVLLDSSPEDIQGSVNSVAPGSIIFGKLRPYLAKVAFLDFNCVCTTEAIVLQPKGDTNGKFLFYQLLSEGFIEIVNAQTYGTKMPRVSAEQVIGISACLPPLAEQRAIAAYLDRETARLDALAAKKLRLIELLREKRAALISDAVTRGLDPAAPRKASGVAWLGAIPAHWLVRRNKRIFVEANEKSVSGDEELLTVSHITGVTPRREKDVNMFLAESMEGYKICRPGDLAVNTMWAWMGAVGIARQAGIVSPSYNVYRLRKQYASEYDPEYLDMMYRTPEYISGINMYSQGVWRSRLRLYPEAFFDLYTLSPTLVEQKQIVQHCAQEVGHINRFIEKLNRSLEKVREYRAALISAAVTGKIDIRELA